MKEVSDALNKAGCDSLNTFALRGENGNIVTECYVCFAGWNGKVSKLNLKEEGLSHICLAITQAKEALSEDQLEEFNYYLDWLMNESVFSHCFITKDVEEAYKSGIFFSVDVYSNQVMAAMVAVRCGWEFPDNVSLWKQFSDSGVDKGFSLILTHFLSYNSKREIHLISGGKISGHGLFGYLPLPLALSNPCKKLSIITPPFRIEAKASFYVYKTMEGVFNEKFKDVNFSDIMHITKVIGRYGETNHVVDFEKSILKLTKFYKENYE